MNENFTITKASGVKASFSKEKLKKSLLRSGASPDQVEAVMRSVLSRAYDGMSTREIHKLSSKYLKESSRHFAAKYRLKKAIMQLGPSGFPFEKFVAEILMHQGFHAETGQIVNGKCVKHEIDVVAHKDMKQFLVECKYHNAQAINCDVKVPLYIQARFEDVAVEWKKQYPDRIFQAWLVTNTRFSDDALRYGTCAGLKLVGWDYPTKGSLKEMIDTHELYPITCLTSLTSAEKNQLLEKQVILCRQLKDNMQLLDRTHMTSDRRSVVLQEVNQLCGGSSGQAGPQNFNVNTHGKS